MFKCTVKLNNMAAAWSVRQFGAKARPSTPTLRSLKPRQEEYKHQFVTRNAEFSNTLFALKAFILASRSLSHGRSGPCVVQVSQGLLTVFSHHLVGFSFDLSTRDLSLYLMLLWFLL